MKRLIITALCFCSMYMATAQVKQTLSLQDCLEKAAENDVRQKNARLDIMAASEKKHEALSLFFPSASLQGFGFRALNPIVSVGLSDVLGDGDAAHNVIHYAEMVGNQYGLPTSWSALDYGYSAGVTITQPVFAGGRIVNGNRLASLGIEAATLQQEMGWRDILVEVTRKYWDIVLLEEKLEVVEQAFAALDSLYRDVTVACKAGIVLDTDTLRVERERGSLQLQRRKLISGIRLSKMDLLNAIGMDYTMLNLEGSNVPSLDNISFQDRLEVEPPERYYRDAETVAAATQESRLLSLKTEAAVLEKRIAMGKTLPEIGIGAAYGYSRILGDPRWNGAVYASVKIPITDWWETGAEVRRLDYETQKCRNEEEYLNSRLVLQMRKLWEDLLCSYDAMLLAEESLILSEQETSRKKDLYDSGQLTLSELLMSQATTREVRDQYIDAKVQYQMAACEYLSR